jgi:hypothetical protein
MPPADEAELAYYRAVEDLFAALRGVPHTLSPRDFHLLRSWWREGVPLAAVRTAVTEVFARRRERGEAGPVLSLAYCRHAVREHAKRLAAMQVGATTAAGAEALNAAEAVDELADRLEAVVSELRQRRPRVADVVARVAAELRAARELPPGMIEYHLYSLESTLLDACLQAVGAEDREAIEQRATAEAAAATANPEARQRMCLALRDRLLRDLLALPRLELPG